MEHEDLKDILLDKEDDGKSKKIKKLLIFGAVLVNIFLIVIVVMKILNSNDGIQAQNDVDSRLVLPPAPAQNIPQANAGAVTQPPIAVEKKDEKLFEQVPIAPENKGNDEFEDMVKKLKEKENSKTAATPSEPKEQPKPAAVEVKEPVVTPPAPQEAQPKEQAKTTAVAQTEPKKAEAKQKNLEDKLAKPEAKFEKEKTATKQTVKPAAKPTAKAVSGAYVQISAVSNFNPNHELIKKLQASGYSYKTAKVGDMTKVLVGPYDDGAQLQKALNDIRQKVNKNAFIYRAK